MFCKNCGKELKDGAKFCQYCGNVVAQADAPAAQNAAPKAAPVAPVTPAAPKIPVTPRPAPAMPKTSRPAAAAPKAPKAGNAKKLIPIVAGVLVVVLVAALLLSGLGGAKGKVMKAFGKSLTAYTEAISGIGMADLSGIEEKQAYSMTMGAEILEFDMSELEGFGLRMGQDFSMKDRKMGITVTPFYGSADLVTANMILDESKLMVGVPEIYGDMLAVDTATLGDMFKEMGAPDELQDFAFNIFDMAQKIMEATNNEDGVKEAEKLIQDALKVLYKEITVEKVGKKDLTVNGNKLKTTEYLMVIPEDAMDTFADALEDALKAGMVDVDYADLYEELLEDAGFPKDAVDDIITELKDEGVDDPEKMVEGIVDLLKDVIKEVEDLELSVFVEGGYVVCVSYEGEIEKTEVIVKVFMGGGKEFADDFSIEAEIDGGAELVLESSGNHTGKGGAYSDTTTLEVSSYYEDMELTVETEYDPKKDTFSFALDTGAVTLTGTGTLAMGKDEFDLNLEELELDGMGQSMVLSLQLGIGTYKENVKASGDQILFNEMDMDEMEEVIMEIAEAAQEWAIKLVDEVPELEDLLAGM